LSIFRLPGCLKTYQNQWPCLVNVWSRSFYLFLCLPIPCIMP
jgi:hypothetical protein